MAVRRQQSWGRYPVTEHDSYPLNWRSNSSPFDQCEHGSLLPFGNGRSYGDVCLNDRGTLVQCRGLDRFIAFDHTSGILRCEAGVLLSELLDLVVPLNWFPPVTPGTRFVTIGGAIANDVHGKNHHRTGTFGRHVLSFELLRSDGSRTICSPTENVDLFRATIGGIGLTGIILWADIQLMPIPSAHIDQEVIRYHSVDEFFDLAAESDTEFEYTVSWVDCVATGSKLGRGLFTRGNHSALPGKAATPRLTRRFAMPIEPPFSLVNTLSLKAFNSLYFHRQISAHARSVVHYEPFFYPLDGVANWNRIYGKNGFLQYQCVIPIDSAVDAISEILARVSRSGSGSFLAVLKMFGDKLSPGLMSFPTPGATLALDFPNLGDRTFRLLDTLDEVTRQSQGRTYPAKDARVRGVDFRDSYPQWQYFSKFIDPRMSSSFWRRVMEGS
jgi:FAD/FMN-containing dehydrogenase